MSRTSSTLSVGAAAPDFDLPAVNGEMVGLWNCLLDGPVMIEFIRGTWCPSARKRLAQLAAARWRFRDTWTRVLVIVCEDPFSVQRHFERRPTPLTVLIDDDRKVVREYGVYQRFAIERWRLARPSTFLVDRAGFIRHIFVASLRTQVADLDELFDRSGRIGKESMPQDK